MISIIATSVLTAILTSILNYKYPKIYLWVFSKRINKREVMSLYLSYKRELRPFYKNDEISKLEEKAIDFANKSAKWPSNRLNHHTLYRP